MNILLIAPASGKWNQVGHARIFNGKIFRFSLMSLLSVAAETPTEHTIRIIDEQIDAIPWNEPFDLVGITCMTALAPRAYFIADRFRQRGVPVVLGGMHPTFCPEEALDHADSVVLGEAEGIWHTVLLDAQNGNLQTTYQRQTPFSMNHLQMPPYHLLQPGRYSTFPVEATRGCPHRCAFCAVSAFHQGIHRKRPIPEIIAQISAIPSHSFIFVDDNLTADPDYAKQLFMELIPLKKQWITQSSLKITENEDLVRLAAEAGCRGLFVGLETFSEGNLQSMHKTCNQVDAYREAIQILHKHGIGVEAGIVFGFDNDDSTVFTRTLAMIDDLQIDMAQISIFTPLPGTPQWDIFQNRIFDRDWAHFDFHHCVFQPSKMSPKTLQEGHDWITHEFYQPWRIARRLARQTTHPRLWKSLPVALALNAAYFGRIYRWNIRGTNPATQWNKKESQNAKRLNHPIPVVHNSSR